MKYFPLALNITGWGCLVAGGGPVGFRRAERFQQAGGRVVVVSPIFDDAFAGLDGVERRERRFEEADLDGIFIAQAATNDPELNRHIAERCRERGILVNVADDHAQSDYLVPALVERGDLTVAITTNAQSPAFGKWLKGRLESWLPAEMEAFISFLGQARIEARQRIADSEKRTALADYLAAPAAYAEFSKRDDAGRSRWLGELILKYNKESG